MKGAKSMINKINCMRVYNIPDEMIDFAWRKAIEQFGRKPSKIYRAIEGDLRMIINGIRYTVKSEPNNKVYFVKI